MSYKLVLIVRNDLKMSKGKIAAQVGHTVVDATIAAIENGKLCKWQKDGETIIALKVENEKTLNAILEIATRKKISNGRVFDSGRTEVVHGTCTVGFVGPDRVDKIDKLTCQLKCL
jgi:PTH2 family peptidyl-tRNA hydrolase